MRAVALLLTCAALVRGAEATSPDVKAVPEGKPPGEARLTPEAKAQLEAHAQAELKAVKAVYGEAQQHNDLWTAIQLESWAAGQRQQLRGAPMLAGTEVFGDPTFACPEDVRTMSDRGDAVEVVTLKRFHLFSLDGRPLSCSVPLGVRGDRTDIAFGNGWVGAVQFDTREDQPPLWQARTVPVTKGQEGGGIQAEFDEQPGVEFGEGELKVADDGSALAVPFRRETNNSNETRVVVTTGKGKRIDVNGVFAPIGVAPGGAWLLANIIQDDRWTPVLVMGQERTPLRSAAMGPGLAAIITPDTGIFLVDRVGKRTPLALPMALSNDAHLLSVGRWLVVSSGGGAKSLPATDFLGVEIPDPPPQPDTLALFRWDDLVADVKAPAVARYQSPVEMARQLSAGIYLWRGQEVDLLDLSGRQPVSRVLYTAAKEIAWAWSRRFWTMISLKGGGKVVVDDQGRELWNGDGEAEIWWRDLAVVGHGKGAEATYELQRLAIDPKQRKTMRLDLGPGQWDISCDPYRERWVARQQRQWQFGDFNGAVIGRGSGGRSRPDYGFGWPPIGRFYFRYGRVYPKDSGEEGNESEHLNPQDAWMMGKIVFLLDRDNRVLLTGHKKAGVWSDLGPLDVAAHFGMINKDELVVANWEPRVVATFGPGSNGVPVMHPEKPARSADPLPEGPWRISNDQQGFAVPHGGAMEFSEDRAGFVPRWLRSPKDPATLVLVTSSLVISLDPASARLVAGPAKR